MPNVAVEQIRLDPNGRLRLRPASPSTYPYIYRAALSVRWDEISSELYVLDVPGFDALAEFKQIRAAVAQEYGDQLALSPRTKYLGMSAELVAAFRESAG